MAFSAAFPAANQQSLCDKTNLSETSSNSLICLVSLFLNHLLYLDIWLAVHHSITFLLLPSWYTNFLFIHTNYIKLNSSTMFRAQSTHYQEVNDANCTYVHNKKLITCYTYMTVMENFMIHMFYHGAHDDAVDWSTVLQAGRFQVEFPMVSLEFFIDWILLSAPWPWVQLSLWQKWVPGLFRRG
jgi:hypothetical protein